MDLFTLINALPETLPPDTARDWKIAHPGKVARPATEVVVGLLAGLSTISVVVRIMLHLQHRGKLFIDDYIVIFATVCLVIETTLVYHNLDMIYVEASLAQDPMNVTLFTRGQILQLFQHFLKWTNIWKTFAWTATYMIKISFLAFFRILVRDVSRRLNVYLWFVLCFTIGAWVFNSIENMILCGAANSLKCFPYPKLNHEIGGISTATDIITDLMIISIPILLLRKAQLRMMQKVRILTFLCLSIIMVAFATARMAGGLMRDSSGVLTYSIIWTTLFLHIECSVAVLMGGVTAFRTVFTRHAHDEESRRYPGSDDKSGTALQRYLKRLFFRSKSGKSLSAARATKVSFGDKLGALRTGPTMAGLRTFIKRNGRSPGQTTVQPTVESDGYDPLESYNNYIRYEQKRPTAAFDRMPSSQNAKSGSEARTLLHTDGKELS